MNDYVRKWLSNIVANNQTNPRVTVSRSPQWHALRIKWLEEHKVCDACGITTKALLEVHHKVPVHIDPSKELDWGNLITLCESPSHNCHLIFGHLLNWKSFNKNVVQDTQVFYTKLCNRP